MSNELRRGKQAGLLACPLGVRSSAIVRPLGFVFRVLLMLLLLDSSMGFGADENAVELFHEGVDSYHAGDYSTASVLFRRAAVLSPAAGTLQNLGIAEWQRGETGTAVLAWEQARWLDPFNESIRDDLRFARKTAQLESPELAWYEVVSNWLPVNWWAWTAAASLWLAISMGTLPGIFRWRKLAWHQAVAAVGLAVFLLSVPAQFGLSTRSHLGFIVQKDVPLRLTPTHEAQDITRLAAGEPARLLRSRGNYYLLRTNHSEGWVERAQFGLICESPKGQ
jgi:hypothetical protein